jgi:hypothetical protein
VQPPVSPSIARRYLHSAGRPEGSEDHQRAERSVRRCCR